jgi:hypothetical protein
MKVDREDDNVRLGAIALSCEDGVTAVKKCGYIQKFRQIT